MQIIIKKSNGSIIRLDPNLNKYGEGKKPFSECKGLQQYIDPSHKDFVGEVHEWYVADRIDTSDVESRKQIYWEDEDGQAVIKKDMSWEKRLMPDHLIKRKLLKKVTRELDEELSKEQPNQLKALRLHRECEKCKALKAGPHNEEIHWTEKALEGLDQRIVKGEADKPVIREKLQAKLQELREKS